MSSDNIYLIGMPGAGKSTLGIQLGRHLKRDHIDLDDLIEKDMDMTVSDIFRTLGEENFRLAEQRALKEAASWGNTIVSTGGGTPCFFSNMQLMNTSGLSIFLDVPIPELVSRLQQEMHIRPLLKNQESLRQTLEKTYDSRKKYYDQATFRLEGRSISIEGILKLI